MLLFPFAAHRVPGHRLGSPATTGAAGLRKDLMVDDMMVDDGLR